MEARHWSLERKGRVPPRSAHGRKARRDMKKITVFCRRLSLDQSRERGSRGKAFPLAAPLPPTINRPPFCPLPPSYSKAPNTNQYISSLLFLARTTAAALVQPAVHCVPFPVPRSASPSKSFGALGAVQLPRAA
eukprot:190808-Rhodomonas_salina.2